MDPGVQPILVTGSHRSGSTWIGQILTADPTLAYLHEPFTRTCRPGVFPFRVPFWYYRVPTAVPPALVADYEKLLRFRYSFSAELPALRTPRDVGRMIRDGFRFAKYRLQRRRPLVKDPLALMSAEWVSRTFNASVLVSSRHPVAFVSSLLRLGWRFDFADLAAQTELMDTLLAEAHHDVEQGRRLGPEDPVVEAAYLWKVLHRVIDAYRKSHPEWIFVRYEDLARDPVAGFESIFPRLGLRFTDAVRKRIEFLSGDANPADRANDPRVTRVASATHAAQSVRRLDAGDRERIRRIVEPVSAAFYEDGEW